MPSEWWHAPWCKNNVTVISFWSLAMLIASHLMRFMNQGSPEQTSLRESTNDSKLHPLHNMRKCMEYVSADVGLITNGFHVQADLEGAKSRRNKGMDRKCQSRALFPFRRYPVFRLLFWAHTYCCRYLPLWAMKLCTHDQRNEPSIDVHSCSTRTLQQRCNGLLTSS